MGVMAHEILYVIIMFTLTVLIRTWELDRGLPKTHLSPIFL